MDSLQASLLPSARAASSPISSHPIRSRGARRRSRQYGSGIRIEHRQFGRAAALPRGLRQPCLRRPACAPTPHRTAPAPSGRSPAFQIQIIRGLHDLHDRTPACARRRVFLLRLCHLSPRAILRQQVVQGIARRSSRRTPAGCSAPASPAARRAASCSTPHSAAAASAVNGAGKTPSFLQRDGRSSSNCSVTQFKGRLHVRLVFGPVRPRHATS